MPQEIAQQLAGWFPLLFLTVFGFVALIWSAMLTMMMLNVLRTLGGRSQANGPADASEEPSSQRVRQRAARSRSRASFPKPQPTSGTAHNHSLPPYISMN